MGWKFLKGQQRNGWLSSSLVWGDNCNVPNENFSNWHRKWQNRKIFQFLEILWTFFQNFRQTSSIATLKRVNKEIVGCVIDFSEEFTVVFQVKTSQIDTNNGKKPKLSNSQSLCIFRQIFDSLRELEFFKGSTKTRLVVQLSFWRDNFNVLNENFSNWHRKWQKPQNFQFFKDFKHFSPTFWQTSSIRTLKNQQGPNLLSSKLRKEIKTVF